MSAEKNLKALSDHLVNVTRSSIVGGHGFTYVKEIKQLDRAVVEIGKLRNGLAKAAQVIAAGDKERRELITQIALLTRAQSEATEKKPEEASLPS